ncbi:MAG: FAD-binding protein [Paludibacteraceae bacterium]|nr:FAD-binding protein [Paludibacteraceae bacterium]
MVSLLTDSLHRIAYATDASAYREMPLAVAYPQSEDDIIALMQEAEKRHTHLIPRAGGTSIAGQVVGNGIVVDVSRYMNRILEINAEERWVRVQPGVVRDELNIALRPYGLFFSPETSTSNRCCIGGMTGNNSCGTHSLVYGSTRHHILSLRAILADGTPVEINRKGMTMAGQSVTTEGDGLAHKIIRQLADWQGNTAIRQLLEQNFPDKSLRRRSCGYAIDECLAGVDGSYPLGELDIAALIAGSEGTLAFLTEITLSLDPLPKREQMVVCAHLDDLNLSWQTNLIALRHHPVAVELMDGKILELGKGNPEAERNRFFIQGNPKAVVIAEFRADSIAEMESDATQFEQELGDMAYACTRVYGNDVARVWNLRKAGLGVLSGMKGDAKPIGVIEDTAVAPERMADYMHDFQLMLREIGLSCVYYGHISTGELHLRPILNIKTEEGKRKFREVAERTAQLVRKHKGSLSGEHGDGRLRGEFIPLMYGTEVYEMMCRLKHTWDPKGILNVGKIVETPRMDEGLRFDVDQRYAIEDTETYFNWRAAFDECKVEGASGVRSQAHALMCSIEQCNGAGDCRKSNLIGGTLCPAYKVLHDETMTTRARANILREVLTRGNQDVWKNADIKHVLESCLACKGCRGECPSSVDMTRVRAEVLQHIYDTEGTPRRSWLVARMTWLEDVGAIVPDIYNWFATNRLTSALIKQFVGFAADRQIPTLCRRSMRQLVKAERQRHTLAPNAQKVYLFADEFTNRQEAELGLLFARLLLHLGYDVEIPRHIESGRAAISKGCLKRAQKIAKRNVTLLADIVREDAPLVGIEPSCILSFRDEYPDLVPSAMRQQAIELGRNCLLFDEFLLREVEQGRICKEQFHALDADIWLHGHCHQKALVGVEKTASLLRLIPEATVHVIPSGCCGMAGSFGYEKEHYATSMAIGEMVLLPAVRKAVAEQGRATIVCAPGTSCRQQIKDGTGVHAVHPLEVLSQALQ